METELFVPQGLWHYKPEEFMQFLATHRFNAIRLPFSYEWAVRGLDTPLLNPYVVQDDMRGYTQVGKCVCVCKNESTTIDPEGKQDTA